MDIDEIIVNKDTQALKNYNKDISFINLTDVLSSCDSNDTVFMKLLIEKGADVNIQNKTGSTALMHASRDGYLDIVKLLIEKGADVNIQNKRGLSALVLALMKGHLDIVKLLIEKGADVNIQDKKGLSALVLALMKGHLDIVKLLIEKGADVNIQDKKDITSLMIASGYGHLDIVKLLIEKGADVNIQNKTGFTALMLASRDGHFEIVKLLIEKGADVNIQDKNAMSALMYTVLDMKSVRKFLKNADYRNIFEKSILLSNKDYIKKDSIELVKLLIENGANPNLENGAGYSVYTIAKESNNTKAMSILRENGANTTQKEVNKLIVFLKRYWYEKILFLPEYEMSILRLMGISVTPLQLLNSVFTKEHFIYKYNELKSFFEFFKILNKNPKDEDIEKERILKSFDIFPEYMSNTRLIDLIKGNYTKEEVQKFIPSNKININEKDYDGKTALFYAVELKKVDMIKLLLKNGADIDIKNNDGKSAVQDCTVDEINIIFEEYSKNNHNPQRLVKLLSNFTIDKPIKYTTHDWDFGELKKEYGNFDAYMSAVKKQFESMKAELQELSPNLYEKIYTFLIEETPDETYSWCHKTHINIGWSSLDGLREWCDNGNKPESFILKKPIYFEEDFETLKLTKFKDIINLFKQEIEIRDNFKNLENLFADQVDVLGKNFNLELSAAKLGRQFYTDVEKFSNVLGKIFADMETRTEYSNIEVITTKLEDRSIEIKITQIGSYSSRSAKELLQRAKQAGDISEINNALANLCDWSVESSFEDEGFRVNFLHSNIIKDIEILELKPRGFTHILRFYK